MKALFLLLLAGAGLFVAEALAQDQPRAGTPAASADAIAAIRKLGGEVRVESAQPGSPTAVVLTGAKSAADCLPHLKDLTNLHTCDL